MNNQKKRRRKGSIIPLIILILIVSVGGFAVGCMPKEKLDNKVASTPTEQTPDKAIESPGFFPTPDSTREAIASPKSGSTTSPESDAAKEIVKNMTLDEKLYQMFFVTPESLTGISSVTQAGKTIKNALRSYPVGGIIYFSSNIRNNSQTHQMIKKTKKYSKIPLFIGVDEEGGRVTRISGNPKMGFEKIPSMEEVGSSGESERAYEVGEQLSKITGDLGFNMDFAPIADMITNPNNTEIGDRSFGKDPKLTAEMVKQVVLGLQDNNICSALKHFPGHGSTQADTHNGYSESHRTIDEMRKEEFIPFQSGIEAGADFVMMSHMSVIKIDSSGKPASLSKKIVTGILKNELNFTGIVITDSLSMGAITNRYKSGEATILAVEAGVDMLLMPSNFKDAFLGLKKAVNSGRISEKRIDKSVRKIIETKIKRGIIIE